MKSTLPLLIWDESFATGIPKIDEQHKFLVNLLYEASIKLSNENNLTILKQVTAELLDYAIYHFEYEETLMKKYNYFQAYPKESKAHLQQHRGFLKKMLVIRGQLKKSEIISCVKLLNCLNQWVVNHILKIDRHFTTYVFSKQVEENRKNAHLDNFSVK